MHYLPHELQLHVARTQQARSAPWSWRHGATLVLIAATVPVFLAGAAVAAVVMAAPLMLWMGVRQVRQAASIPLPPR
jgi:hypothetical protein